MWSEIPYSVKSNIYFGTVLHSFIFFIYLVTTDFYCFQSSSYSFRSTTIQKSWVFYGLHILSKLMILSFCLVLFAWFFWKTRGNQFFVWMILFLRITLTYPLLTLLFMCRFSFLLYAFVKFLLEFVLEFSKNKVLEIFIVFATFTEFFGSFLVMGQLRLIWIWSSGFSLFCLLVYFIVLIVILNFENN